MANEEYTGDIEPATEEVLPSEEVVEPTLDDFIKENTSENGKLYGQFDDVESALKHYRKQEITHTNNMRELKNDNKAKQEEVQSVQAELETIQKQEQVIESLIPSFIENDMKLTDDMLAQITETGLDERDVRLKAYEVKDNAEAMKAKAYAVTNGDAEEYNNMISWANEQLSDSDKNSFDKAIKGLSDGSDIGLLAIEGLYNRYQKRDGIEQVTPQRVQGTSPKTASNRGYTNFDELRADRAKAQNNPVLREQYLKKLSMTDDRVLSLR